MRKAYLMLAIATCVASPLALAQSRDTSADRLSTAVATTVQTQTADATRDRASPPKSAFGQVMGVLTHLLQEAATKRATGTQSNASLPDDSELTIIVTPIDGQSTFTPVEKTDAAPPTSVGADTAIDAPAGSNSAQVAVQDEGDGAG